MYKTKPSIKKHIEKRLETLDYRIIVWDRNKHSAINYNIFCNASLFRFLSDFFINELYLCNKEGRNFNREAAKKEIMSSMAYCFWTKYEYEIDVCQHFNDQEKSTCYDGYAQLEMNKNIVLNYIISNLLECVKYKDRA